MYPFIEWDAGAEMSAATMAALVATGHMEEAKDLLYAAAEEVSDYALDTAPRCGCEEGY